MVINGVEKCSETLCVCVCVCVCVSANIPWICMSWQNFCFRKLFFSREYAWQGWIEKDEVKCFDCEGSLGDEFDSEWEQSPSTCCDSIFRTSLLFLYFSHFVFSISQNSRLRHDCWRCLAYSKFTFYVVCVGHVKPVIKESHLVITFHHIELSTNKKRKKKNMHVLVNIIISCTFKIIFFFENAI